MWRFSIIYGLHILFFSFLILRFTKLEAYNQFCNVFSSFSVMHMKKFYRTFNILSLKYLTRFFSTGQFQNLNDEKEKKI